MKILKNRCFYIVFDILVFLVFVFVINQILPCKISEASNEVLNLTINEKGIASWNPIKGAVRYTYNCSNFGGAVNETSLNLKELLVSQCVQSGTYSLVLRAVDENNSPLTSYSIATYEYTSKADVNAPQNVYWDGYIAKWDEVKKAVSYDVFVYTKEGKQVLQENVKKNQCDFSRNQGLCVDNEYFFKVVARGPEGYGCSLFSANSTLQKGWYHLSKVNGSIDENGVLTWNKIDGAYKYQWYIEKITGSILASSEPRISIAHILKYMECRKGTYEVTLYAIGDTDSNYSVLSDPWTGKFEYHPNIFEYKEELVKIFEDSSIEVIALKEDIELLNEDVLLKVVVNEKDRVLDLNGHTIKNSKDRDGAIGCGIIVVFENDEKTFTVTDSKGTGKVITDSNIMFGITNVKNYTKNDKPTTYQNDKIVIINGVFEKTRTKGHPIFYNESGMMNVIIDEKCKLPISEKMFNANFAIQSDVEKTEVIEALPSGEEVLSSGDDISISGEQNLEGIPVSGEIPSGEEITNEKTLESGEEGGIENQDTLPNQNSIDSSDNSGEILQSGDKVVALENDGSGENIIDESGDIVTVIEKASESGESTSVEIVQIKDSEAVASGENQNTAEEPIPIDSIESGENIIVNIENNDEGTQQNDESNHTTAQQDAENSNTSNQLGAENNSTTDQQDVGSSNTANQLDIENNEITVQQDLENSNNIARQDTENNNTTIQQDANNTAVQQNEEGSVPINVQESETNHIVTEQNNESGVSATVQPTDDDTNLNIENQSIEIKKEVDNI